MRIEHRSASRHITDEQTDQATEEKERRPNFARAEIKVRLSKINSDAGDQPCHDVSNDLIFQRDSLGGHTLADPI